MLCYLLWRSSASAAQAAEAEELRALTAETVMRTQAEAAAETAPVRVAIIDSGISTGAVSVERIAAGSNYIRPQDDTEDKLGHGTAVAAIIAGSEAAKLSGLCTEVQLVPLVCCTADQDGRELRGNAALAAQDGREVSGGTAMTAQAVYDAVDVYGCRIINISSGTATDSKALRDAVDYAASRGALVVSSAGNAGRADPDAVYYLGAF